MIKTVCRRLFACVILALVSCSGVDLERTGIVKLSDHTYAFIAPGTSADDGLGANAGFVVGESGVLVVDSRYRPPLARELLDMIRSVTDAPVRFVVNTHYHPDHTWGNEVFKKEGAVILARSETRRDLEIYSPAYMEYYETNKPDVFRTIKDIEVTLPDSLIGDGLTIDLGGIGVELEYFGPAHTAGDCIVSVPRDRVVFTGGVLSNAFHPNMGDSGADFDNWIAVLERIGGMKPRYLVPGQGNLCRRNALEAQARYITTLRRLCTDAIRRAIPLDQAIGTVAVPGTEGYEQENILPFNIQAVFRREVLGIVQPPFTLETRDGFAVADGGGGTKHGWVRWTTEGPDGFLEIEVQWNPTSRTGVIVQDINDRMAHYLASSEVHEMTPEGSKHIDIGGEQTLVSYGNWRFKPGTGKLGGGIWSWAMTIRDGVLYSIKMSTNAGKIAEKEQANIARLEKLASTFALKKN